MHLIIQVIIIFTYLFVKHLEREALSAMQLYLLLTQQMA